MQAPAVSFCEWQARYATDEACAAELADLRWPDGFRCPQCGHDHGWYCRTRRHDECARCYHQTSLTAGTRFHGSRVPLTKWFWALYWVGTDKGGISALRLSKLIDVQWRTAYAMLRRLRIAMGQRDRRYRLTDLIEVDDAYLGANKTGKAGRGGGRPPILVAIEKTAEGKPGFVAIEALDSLSKPEIVDFAKRHLHPDAICHTDAFPSLSFLLGTYQGAVRPHRLQEYIDEFVYRFNRRFWEPQIPNLSFVCASGLCPSPSVEHELSTDP